MRTRQCRNKQEIHTNTSQYVMKSYTGWRSMGVCRHRQWGTPCLHGTLKSFSTNLTSRLPPTVTTSSYGTRPSPFSVSWFASKFRESKWGNVWQHPKLTKKNKQPVIKQPLFSFAQKFWGQKWKKDAHLMLVTCFFSRPHDSRQPSFSQVIWWLVLKLKSYMVKS